MPAERPVERPETAGEHLRNALQLITLAEAGSHSLGNGRVELDGHLVDAIRRRVTLALDTVEAVRRVSAGSTAGMVRDTVRRSL